MLKVIANLYSDSKENFNEVAEILKDNGYSIAYNSESSGIVILETEEEA